MRKATVPVTVDAGGVQRYARDVEATVYFCVLEALQSVQKYASASRVGVRLREDGQCLSFEVEDDGAGFDVLTTRIGSRCVRFPSSRRLLNNMRTASIEAVMPDVAVRHAQSDDELRFERLIEPHLGDAFALAQALSADRSSAQDAVQSAAFKAWRWMGQLRDDSRARAWFLTIVVNECRSSWRKRKPAPADPHSGVEAISWPPAVDQRLDVRSVMRRLKSDDRTILSLRFLMDMSVEEFRKCARDISIGRQGADRPSGVQVSRVGDPTGGE